MSNIRVPVMPEPENLTPWASTRVLGFTTQQLAALNAEWLEKVGPILKELKDAATSLETIGRLAGKTHYVGDDGERTETCMGHHDQVRGYANSRASVARAALSAITKD